MLNKLYKASQRMTQFKLFEQFNKLLDRPAIDIDEDTKRAHKLTNQLQLDEQGDMEEVEEKNNEENWYWCINYL